MQTVQPYSESNKWEQHQAKITKSASLMKLVSEIVDGWHLSSSLERSGNGAEMSAVLWSGRHADVVTSMCCG